MSSPVFPLSPKSLTHYSDLLNDVSSRDRFRLQNTYQRLLKTNKAGMSDSDQQGWQKIISQIEQSYAVVKQRKDVVPAITFPEALPVSDKREEIAEAIQNNQVLILAGETGSGKTTQLPKICLSIGRGVRGLIGHTQPRRIAARTVAMRIAEELNTPLGESVGYQVRFTDQASDNTHIKLMTDGILLAGFLTRLP